MKFDRTKYPIFAYILSINKYSLISFVLAMYPFLEPDLNSNKFFIWITILGPLFFGIIGLRQIKRTKEKGITLALIGIAISAVYVAMFLVLLVIGVGLYHSGGLMW